ncbi:MAG: hypothetical protein RIT27_1790 [Pseudomonadota bacterium]|jgi:LysM repeat protein
MQIKYVGILVLGLLSASCGQLQYAPENSTNSPPLATTEPNSGKPTVFIYDPLTGTSIPQEKNPSETTASTSDTAIYTVKKGDTVYSIGRAYHLVPSDIIAWNGLTPPYNLSIGQTLRLRGVPTDSSPSSPTIVPSSSGTYYVRKGDTVYSIAKRHGCDPQDILAWNGLSSPNNLQEGQALRVVPSKTAAKSIAKKPAPANLANHTVAANETLYSIAKRYGQDVEEVAHLNDLSTPYVLTVGQILRVKAVASAAKPKKLKTTKKPVQSKSAKPLKTVKKQSTTADDEADDKSDKSEENAKPTKTASSSNSKSSGGFEIIRHKVVSGDTLDSIASKHGQKVEDVGLWNGIAPPYSVQEGQIILIYK